jgi:hypothetical protein
MLSTGFPLLEKVDTDKIDHHGPHLVFKAPERVFLSPLSRLFVVVVCQRVDAERFVGDTKIGIEFCRNRVFLNENPVVLRIEKEKGENGFIRKKAFEGLPGGSVVREEWARNSEVQRAEEVANMLGSLGVQAKIKGRFRGEVTLKQGKRDLFVLVLDDDRPVEVDMERKGP